MTDHSEAMPDVTSVKSAHRPHHWRRDLVELAAVFTAVAVADVVANLVGHGPGGPPLLIVSAVTLLATAVFHIWWARRHRRTPATDADRAAGPHTNGTSIGGGTGDISGADGTDSATGTGTAARADSGTTLWRLRTTVRDSPGSLAALCSVLAGLGVDILTLQTHPLAEGTVDEFLLRAPTALPARRLAQEISAAGGG
ncbi:GNAT family N-acetyltransferase, partial [Streptomyces sp. NPDC055078]